MFRDDLWWMVILVKSLSLAFELLKILLCIAFIVLPVCIFFLLINAPALAIERELEECGKNVSRVWSITNLTLNLANISHAWECQEEDPICESALCWVQMGFVYGWVVIIALLFFVVPLMWNCPLWPEQTRADAAPETRGYWTKLLLFVAFFIGFVVTAMAWISFTARNDCFVNLRAGNKLTRRQFRHISMALDLMGLGAVLLFVLSAVDLCLAPWLEQHGYTELDPPSGLWPRVFSTSLDGRPQQSPSESPGRPEAGQSV